MEVENSTELKEVFVGLKLVARNFKGSLEFCLKKMDEKYLYSELLALREGLKRPCRIFLSFKIESMKRELLESIGEKCHGIFDKLEITTEKYYLNVQKENFMYHLVNFSLLSETTTSTDSDY